MKEIQLNKVIKGKPNYLKYKAIVDDEDFEKVNGYNWNIREGYAVTWINKKTVKLHNFVMEYREGFVVDHINRNGLDNRKINLRYANHRENCMNKGIRKRQTSSIYKGVSWHKRDLIWVAYIVNNYKMIHLGRFKTEIEAGQRYNQEATKLFGKFANLNNIQL